MRKWDSRRLLAGLAGVMLVLTVAACGGSDENDQNDGDVRSVRFGYIADFNGTSVVAVAQEQDLWAKHGLDADLKSFTNGPLQVQALNAGDLDFGYLGPGALWLPASGQAKVVAVNSVGLADRVIAQPGIASIADLRGRTVGVPEGTSGDMILRLALADAGMTLDDVEVVAMDPSTVVAAFSSGEVDAAGIWYPLIDTIREQVPELVELAKNEDFPDNTFPTVFVARNQVAEQDTELVERVVAVIREANDLRAGNVEEAISITADFLNVPAENLQTEAQNVRFLTSADLDASTADGSIVEWLRNLNEMFVTFGNLETATDPSTYYLGDIYTAAG